WLFFRVNLFSTAIVLLVALYGIYFSNPEHAAAIGLALGLTAELTELLTDLMNIAAMLEAGLVSVERLANYINQIPQEAPDNLPTDPKQSEWPKNGEIVINDLEVRYASKEEAVLKDVKVFINGGEKVGIVGRTGSGKSTLLTALFRLVEPSKGQVVIDGVDVSTIGLHTLRNRLQIIPQDPVLFTGTIRSNIDATNKHTDAEIWDALTIVGLKEYVSELALRLDAPVTENGENLSLGQRQLLTLARAICARPKILVMDEASSAVDAAADSLIVDSIRTHFKDATVISIAHRLNTVAGFDRILVLDDGRVVEFDSPANLLRMEGGIFKGLVNATGAENAELIKRAAEERERINNGLAN
ncbi:Multidrug resistance-associated protein 6, partial [Blyttiomyces sp. JEL0837]